MHALFKDYLPKQILAELPSDETLEKQLNYLLKNNKSTDRDVLVERWSGRRRHENA